MRLTPSYGVTGASDELDPRSAWPLALSSHSCVRLCSHADRPRWPAGTLVDLSHDYSDQTVFWPTAESFRLDKVADGVTPQGYYYAANNFATSEHGGTHIDAPVHFAKGHRSVDQIPLEQLVGDAIVVDVTASSATQPDYRVTTDDSRRGNARTATYPPPPSC